MNRLIPILGAAALFAAGCGSSNNDNASTQSGGNAAPATTTAASAPATTPAGSGQALSLSADPGGALKFDKSDLSAKAGRVTIVMKNPSSLPHAIAVEGNGVDKDGPTVGNGGASRVTVTLKPGKYEFYCPVDGHKQAGMEGHLTVS
ncbi:MAG TPA: plastocyanin/azurin family copper-binding protein [Gaiellales bacterium]|nr:plastocyanin/azurin family copper-binding protein [Gaiellales bacterium]